MKIIEVIESRHYRNTITNNTASLYGAVPWQNASEAENWIIETRGYTWRLDDGTIGLGRQPVKTKSEAIEIMNIFNQKRNI